MYLVIDKMEMNGGDSNKLTLFARPIPKSFNMMTVEERR